MFQNKHWRNKGNAKLWDDFRTKRNTYVSLSRTSLSKYFEDRCSNGEQSRTFWQTVRPFMSSKGDDQNEIMLCENDQILSDPKIVGDVFNDYFITATKNIGINEDIKGLTIPYIIDKYKTHPSIININKKYNGRTLSLLPVSIKDTLKLLTGINPKKATGFDQLPPKLIRIAGPAIAPSLTALINNTISSTQFPADMKCAELSPVYKKGDNLDKTKYCPISILPCLSKVAEGAIINQMWSFFSNVLDTRISAFRKHYNTQSVLVKAVEDWRKALDEGKYVGAILMDLSKVFDVLPHGLILAKLHAYGCDINVLKLMYSYLTDRKQRTKMGSTRSNWKTLKKGLPQGSLMGPPIFNIFLNDMFLILEACDDYNYADDNTLSDVKDTPDELKESLESDAESVTDWFIYNGMKANPDKYQCIVFGSKQDKPTSFTVKGMDIKCSKEVNLLGIHIDAGLTFKKQIMIICKKAGKQTSAIMRLSTVISIKVKLAMYRTFILSNFNYCPVMWMFCGQGNLKKMEAIQLKALRFVFYDFNSSYEELLVKSGQPSIAIHLIQSLAIEVYKCLNNIAPKYLCTLLTKHNIPYELRDNNILTLKRFKTVTYGKKSFVYLGSKLWNSLPPQIKNAISLDDFKDRLKTWDGPCDCSKWN